MSSLSTRETDRLSVDGHLFFPVKTVKTNHTEITEAAKDRPSPWCAENPVEALPSSTIIAACETYRKKFPVANFLHYPSLIAELSSNPASVDPVFVAALLSLCVRFMPDHRLEAAETYAEYACKQLAHRAFEAPSLYLAQSLVMITFYEWGSGRPYKAWMYSGMATYMIQSLLKTADDSMEHNPQDFQASQTQYEQLVRTYWCCFAQDCELSSGARQHFALSFRQISVPLPTSDRDFNFGRLSSHRLMPSDMSKHSPLSRNLTIDYGLTIVTRGFDIFVRILRFANESRRGRTLTLPQDPSSPRVVWQRLKEELDEWRFLQDVTVRYPATSAQAHVALGYGELFAYINLVYFMSILFLYRDQLLSSLKPHADLLHDSQPLSNVDESQPIGQLFDAAQNIGGILAALEVSGAPVITPYSGFSIFVAAHINMYGTVCPQRYPGGLERAEEEKRANLAYLERLSKYWPVGQNWWRTVQEANRFYEIARNNQLHVRDGAGHLTIAGTLDEYGDIRSVRPRQEESQPILERENMPTALRNRNSHQAALGSHSRHPGTAPMDAVPLGESHELQVEMLQWPFIDESWSLGFDTGFDTAWPSLGLNDLVGFIVALVALKISQRSKHPKELSFGWQRAQLLGAFFNGVFLLSLGISIFLQSIDRFVSLERIENPKLVLIVGCVGLALNLISGLFLHEHDHGESNTVDSPDNGVELSTALSSLERRNSLSTRVLRPHVEHRHNVKSQAKKGHDLGMMGVLIHVLGDAANNLGVIIAALVVWKAKYEGRYYADPAVSMAIAIVILLSSLPLGIGTILLQSVPLGVDPEDVKHDLEAIPGVESVHELHIWRLNQEKALASVHLAVSDELIADFMETAKIINECFHAYGIHSTTLQPEHVRPIPSDTRSIQGQETAGFIVDGGVKKRHVIDPNSGASPETLSTFRISQSKISSQSNHVQEASGDLVTANAYQNSELFWALRGGGGGTFGIVTRVTVRTFEEIPVVVTTMNITTAGGDPAFWTAVADFHAVLPAVTDARGGGYYFIIPNLPWENNQTLSVLRFYLFHTNTSNTTEVGQMYEPLMKKLNATAGVYTQYMSLPMSSVHEALSKLMLVGDSDETGSIAVIFSRLFSKDLLTSKDGPARLASAMSKFRYTPWQTVSGMVVGGGAVAENAGKVDSALNPAWRKAIAHIVYSRSWSANATLAQQQAVIKNVTEVELPLLQGVEGADKMGAYVNEAFAYEPNFQESFWGRNYRRLYRIKQKWDPAGLFVARRMVGSEDWDEQGLCRVAKRALLSGEDYAGGCSLVYFVSEL
ncbi:hypothetical protein KXW96_003641 [Aspergillus fumigatus]|nr:hypothetical protein KXW96_003641 [Aspergillus fumigatus]